MWDGVINGGFAFLYEDIIGLILGGCFVAAFVGGDIVDVVYGVAYFGEKTGIVSDPIQEINK